jgi:hypothetical protein
MCEYSKHPEVEYVEPVIIYRRGAIPNDAFFTNLWGHHNTGQTISENPFGVLTFTGIPDADIDAPEAWDVQTGSSSVIVADIDSGVDYNHYDLSANIWTSPGEIHGNGIDDDGNGFVDDVRGWDFCSSSTPPTYCVTFDSDPMDENGHGTHIGGIIAAEGNNGQAVTGVAWRARLMSVKILDANGGTSPAAIANGILYASQMGAKIANLSSACTDPSPTCFNQTVENALNTASQRGMLVVTIAGNNSGNNNDVDMVHPCNSSAPNVICVTATDYTDGLASFSNFGQATVDLAAPGDRIMSTVPVGNCQDCDPNGIGLRFLAGTSQAAPFVTGTAALLLSQTPGLTVNQLKQAIFETVDRLPSLTGRTVTGGRLNVNNALRTHFKINASPTTRSVLVGAAASTTFTVTIKSLQGFNRPVTLSLTSPDPSITGNFSINPLTTPADGSATSVLTVSTSSATPMGTYDLTLRGTDDLGETHSMTLTLSVDSLGPAWVARYNGPTDSEDVAQKITTDNSENVYVAGTSCSLNDGCATSTYTIVKYNGQGNQLWQAQYSGGVFNQLNALAVDGAGNVYVTGYSSSAGPYRADTVKYDSNGQQLWVARYDAGGIEDRANALALDASGNVFVTGISCLNVDCSESGFLTVKYDTNGAQLWSRLYNNNGQYGPTGAPYPHGATALGIDDLGNTYVMGPSTNPISQSYYLDYAIVKYNTAGDQIWVNRYDSGTYDIPNAVAVDGSGSVYVTGYSCSDPECTAGWNYLTIKYDTVGNQLWLDSYAANGGFEQPISLAVDGAGNVYIASSGCTDLSNCSINYDYFTIKYDANGNQLWFARYDSGDDDEPASLAVDAAGNVHVTGFSCSPNQCSSFDYLTIKYDPNGSPIWLARHDTGDEDHAVALALDNAGNVYVTGYLENCNTGTCLGEDFITIKYAQINTFPGSNVTVNLGQGVTITFSEISSPGKTESIVSSSGPNPPDGFRLGTPPRHYDISTTATYTPPITLCITYNPAEFGNPNALRLLHYENNRWVDVTTSNDTINHVICGQVSSLSPFIIGSPGPAAPTSLTAADSPSDAGGAVDLNWAPSTSAGIIEQRIYRGTTSGGPYNLITTVTNNTTSSYTDTGLTNGQNYCYVIRAFDGTNESTNSNETCAIPLSNLSPSVVTSPASSITHDAATLNGTANPNGTSGTVWFEWGLTTAYGNSTSAQPISGSVPNTVSTGLSGLQTNTTYHYRIVAQNANGTSYGDDVTFSTILTLLSIDVTPTDPVVIAGQTQQFTATGLFSDGSSRMLGPGDLWGTKAPMPTPRYGFAVGVVNGILYAVGGHNGTNHLNRVEAYDPGTNTWSVKTSMPTARSSLAVGVVNGILYAVGGTNSSGARLATVEAYDPSTDTWTAKASMPTGRYWLGAGVVDGILYTIGGIGGNPVSQLGTVEAYDPVVDSWISKTPMPTPRSTFSIGTVNGILYAVGGNNAAIGFPTNLIGTLEAYNPATNSWSTKTPMPTARGRAAASELNGLLYVLGGDNYTGILGTVETYNPTSNSWETKNPIPTSRYDLSAGTVNGILYTVGGIDNNLAASSNVEAYTPPGEPVPLAWSSSDFNVATIDSAGQAMSIGSGVTTITATSGSISGNTTFTVIGPPTSITSSASSIAQTTATLNGSINPHLSATSGWFEWGLTTAYSNSTGQQVLGSGNTAVPISQTISGLLPNTLYHFRVVGQNSVGISYGVDQTFTMLPDPPAVTTGSAANVKMASATLNGTANPGGVAGTAWFEYGQTTSYGSTSSPQAIAGSSANNVALQITGLAPHTLYHYRIVAQNSSGTTIGADGTFTTSNGMIFYSVAGSTTPSTKEYSDTTNSFDAAITTIAGGTALQSEVKASPTKTEFIAGYVNSTGVLQVMCYDGTTWTNEWSVTVGGTGTTRRFDIAYETNSGDVLVFYSRNVGTTNELGYRTKAGSTGCGAAHWSAATNFDSTVTSGIVHWVKLGWDRRGASDLVTAIWADAASDLGAAIWSGAAWGNQKQLETTLQVVSAAQDVEAFDVEYESLSGDVLTIWGRNVAVNANGVRYATCTGGTAICTWSAVLTPPTWADDATHLDLSANPNTDEMAFASIGKGQSDLQVGYWSGSAWTNKANLDTTATTPTAGTRFVATGWLINGSTTRSIITYYDSAATNVGWVVGNGGTFTLQTDFAPTPGLATQRQYDIQTDPTNKDRLMFTVSNSASDIFAKRLVMSSTGTFTWSNADGGAALELNTASTTYKIFDFVYGR